MTKLLSIIVFFVALLAAHSVWAEGLVGDAAKLPAADRTLLRQQIDAARAAHPEDFQAVREVKGYRPETYLRFRNPIPVVGRELRSFGAKALLPMIEALVFEAPPRGNATDREWEALAVGMLEAVGVLRDPRAASTLHVVFREGRSVPVMLEAAQAMGRLCDDESFELLEAALGESRERRFAALSGLGQCRRVASARLLADALELAQDPDEAQAIAEALGNIGSSWVWDALGPEHRADGLEVRRISTEALLQGFVQFQDDQTRAALRRGIAMNVHPDLRLIAAPIIRAADGVTAQDLERLVARIERREARR